MKKTTIGIIGLGKMGGNMALQAIDKGYQVIGYDLNNYQELQDYGVLQVSDMDAFVAELASPKIVFIYVPAGAVIDRIIEQLSTRLQENDIIVDGGNSYWGDSVRRAQELKEHGIAFVDCGTSGGVDGARNGACFMAGGEPEAMVHVSPILKDLAVENGYVHTGGPGSGHYVKLVHNGIEFGMLQAIAEGMDLLSNYREDLNFPEILKTWNHGSVIRSWLIELMAKSYNEQQGFESVPSYIEDTGEVNWLVADAMRMEVPVPVIAQSVMQLFASRNSDRVADKAIAMMRNGFGGHPFGPDEGIRYERKYGKLENIESSYLYKKKSEQ
ncbi:6-phosphogluconate dehydrogenase [Arcticibacter pallidicorallinus]|uniref:6-phosphogluconate dehydrogenase n=1 Tax=Arcticibacter pallidicorallinus TaxID=1259464 RepID=A0A2T0U3R3_9SPHI|nr:decarboxylating 6-phosphogluconate dehydrogenase [Arcticibacter pallidicorallinus]PRY52540.1 6-phosphogluconate dehydrogenase [Arcticibacter pallidicorallinus]